MSRVGREPREIGVSPERRSTKVAGSRRAPMSWMQRLERVFHIDIEHCGVCGGTLRVIACIETPLKCRSRSELARSSISSSPISPRATPVATTAPAHRRFMSRKRNPRPPHHCPHRERARRGATAPLRLVSCIPLPTAFLTSLHDCPRQMASPRTRLVCSRTGIEPGDDDTDTAATMSIDGLFYLSV